MRKLLLILLVPLILVLAGQTPVSAAKSWNKVVDEIELTLQQSLAVYESGEVEKAKKLINDAYYGIYEKEGMEIAVKSKISGRRANTEEYAYTAIKKLMTNKASEAQIQREMNTLITMMREDAAQMGGGKQQNPVEIFLEALLTLLREGVTVLLVIGAAVACLTKSGNASQTRKIYYGFVTAIGVSFLTAVLLQKIFGSNSANQRLLEGATLLAAMAVLLSINYRMLGRVKAKGPAAPNGVEGEIPVSLSGSNTMIAGLAAFLAVYGKGTGTVLLYQALFSDADGQSGIIWGGFGLGCLILAGIFQLVCYVSRKMPLKPFFIGTSILLYLLALSFAGSGLKGLQEAGIIGATAASGFPVSDILGIYPTWETLLPQLALLALAGAGVIYQQGAAKW